MAQAYVDKIFASYKQNLPALTKGLTRTKWLGETSNGWRQGLRAMGKKAAELEKLGDISEARDEWVRFTRRNRNKVGQHIAAVPVLEHMNRHALLTDEAFREFMKKLATLAKL